MELFTLYFHSCALCKIERSKFNVHIPQCNETKLLRNLLHTWLHYYRNFSMERWCVHEILDFEENFFKALSSCGRLGSWNREILLVCAISGLTKIINATYAAKKGFLPTVPIASEVDCGSYIFDVVRSYLGKILLSAPWRVMNLWCKITYNACDYTRNIQCYIIRMGIYHENLSKISLLMLNCFSNNKNFILKNINLNSC